METALMLPLNGYFEGMSELIKPPAERLELAKTLPATVRDHLVKSDRLETMADEPKTRLVGSYGRKTGVDDIKDVDVAVFVARRYTSGLPEIVLDDLAAALKDLEVDGYGKGEVKTRRKNRRSHHVEFSKDGEQSFHIDCVPVVRPGDDPGDVLQIPDREWAYWDSTQPIGYGERLTKLNQANDGKVLPTIRMFKRIRNHHLRKGLLRPKSYWLESKVYALWHDGRLSKDKCWADLMYALLNAVRDDCGPTRLVIFDPCLRRNLTASWEQAEYDKFVAMLDKVIGYLDPIANEADSDKTVAAWKKVFGDDVFELSGAASKAAAAARLAAAGATVTKMGTVLPASGEIAGAKIPSHRFFGDR
jgi:hypothetical protein